MTDATCSPPRAAAVSTPLDANTERRNSDGPVVAAADGGGDAGVTDNVGSNSTSTPRATSPSTTDTGALMVNAGVRWPFTKLRRFDFEVTDGAWVECKARLQGPHRLAYGSTLDVARQALDKQEVDREGLDKNDRRYLETLLDVFGGGPTGVEAIAASAKGTSPMLRPATKKSSAVFVRREAHQPMAAQVRK